MFNHRKVAINYNLIALLDMLCLECKSDIISADMPGLNYILLPPSNLESPITYETSQINNKFQKYERGQE
jgi:hypothetical protein